MVRIGPGAPDEVRFTEEEKSSVERAAFVRDLPLSTFIRRVGVGAAVMVRPAEEDAEARDIILAAAEACNLRLGEWLRLVILAAVGHTPLPAFLAAGVEFVGGTEP